MVTIIVIAHSEFANSLALCIEHIWAKKLANLHIISINKTEGIEHVIDKTEKFINKVSHNNQVLLLTDLFGATPSNIATRLLKPGKIEMITGLNMPMLLKATSYSNHDLKVCIEKSIEGGKTGIIYLNGENIE